jgi:hypothetical protein
MKNARIVALMFVAAFATMTTASAQEAVATGTSHGLSMYEPAAVSGPAEKPSAVESGAKKLGSFFGKIVKAPVRVAQALAGGVKEGFSQPSAAPKDQGGFVSHQDGASTSMTKSAMSETTSSSPLAMRQRISQMFARAKASGQAPVEDRSVSAAVAAGQSTTSSTQLSTWDEQTGKAVPVAQNQLF